MKYSTSEWGKRFKHWASIWKTKPDRPSGPSGDMPCWFHISLSRISLSFHVIIDIWFLSQPVISISSLDDWAVYDMCTMRGVTTSWNINRKTWKDQLKQIPDPFASPEALASLPQEHAEELLEQLDCGLLETVLEVVLEIDVFLSFFTRVLLSLQGTFANIIDS